MDWNLTLSIVSMLVGTVLSIVSIAISLYFYTEAKNTEKAVSTMLAQIQQQTGALERLNGRLLDRLTRAVTESARPEHEERRILTIVQAVREFVVPAAPPRLPAQGAVGQQERQQLIAVTAVCLYYASIANTFAQDLLPASVVDLNPTVRGLVDGSHTDVVALRNMLEGVVDEIPEIQRGIYDSAITFWAPFVRDTLAEYQRRGTTETPPDT